MAPEPAIVLLLLASLAIGYTVKRRTYLGAVDPLQLWALSEGVWVVTVYQLFSEGIATLPQATMFAVCLMLWWSAWAVLGERWGSTYRRAMAAFWQRIVEMKRSLATRLVVLYLLALSIQLGVTLAAGGGGDNRLAVLKLLRPIESVTTLLAPVILFRLIVAESRRSKVLLLLILLALIATGGKSSILSLLVPVTGAVLIGRFVLRARTLAALGAIGLLGFAASLTLNYGVTDPLEVLNVLYTRISLDGDVYLLALPNDLLSSVSTTSLTTYLLGPLIKVLFLPIEVDTNIGAQLLSLLYGEDTPNGPNPHWPIVLLAYHRSTLAAIGLSALCFVLVLWVKLRLPLRLARRQSPLWLVIPFNAFVLLYPQTFFADPSFPVIYLVQAGILSLLLGLVLRRVYPPSVPVMLPAVDHVSERSADSQSAPC